MINDLYYKVKERTLFQIITNVYVIQLSDLAVLNNVLAWTSKKQFHT